ncbi:MAG: ATP synthase F1 subunit gamma [Bacteroidales bacterium]|nr:ATP synthase F1 subunit gamma [Bacteroidales bacterium]
MASLREIKGRIASVGSTLKITSAMKLVASAKLRKAQQAIGNMLPYENHLHRILLDLMSSGLSLADRQSGSGRVHPRSAAAEYGLSQAAESSASSALLVTRPVGKVAIVAFSSNSSLCGAFNANAIRETLSVINEYRAAGLQDGDITVYSIGRKMQEAMKKAGFVSPADFTRMAEHPGYDAASTLAQELLDGFVEGRFDKVELVYNHFKSTSSQVVTRKTYLPLDLSEGPQTLNAGKRPEVFEEEMPSPKNPEDLIVEPSPEELIGILLPKVVRLRIFTTLLDSNAAEHAARTVAMQTATDNGNDLLQELTLEYNKSRQQKITSEILDIVGGSLQ